MDHNTIEAQLQKVEQECRKYLAIVPNDQTATQIFNAAQNIRQRIGNDLVAYGGEVRNLYQHIVNLFEQSRVQFEQQQQQQQYQQQQQQYQQQQQQQQYQQQYQQQQKQQQQKQQQQQQQQKKERKVRFAPDKGGKKTKKNRQHNKRIKSTRRKSTRRKSIHRR